MTPIETIHATCDALGTYPPRVKNLPHAIIVSMRNGDGERVTIALDPAISADEAAEKIRIAYKTRAAAGAMSTSDMLRRIAD